MICPNKNHFFCLFFSLLLSACASSEQVVWVNSMRADCVGVDKQRCLLIQQSDSLQTDGWENLFSSIEGFEYEAGYIYKLKVQRKEASTSQAPADAPSVSYRLVEVLEKKTDQKMRLQDSWVLETLAGETISVPASNQIPRLELNLADQRVMGTDGCNRFNGSIQQVGQEELRFGPLMSTRMACPNATLPNQFMNALKQVRGFQLASLQLLLLDENGAELMRLKKVD